MSESECVCVCVCERERERERETERQREWVGFNKKHKKIYYNLYLILRVKLYPTD